MRKLSLVFIALLFSGTALFASPSSNSLQSEDAQFLFGIQKANVELISQNEMAETEGKWIANFFGAVIGGYGTGIGYLAGAGNSQNSSSFTGAFLSGAVGGWFSPVYGVRMAVRNTGIAFTTGYIGGYPW